MKNKTFYTALVILILLFGIGFSAYYYGKSKAEHTIEWKEIRYTQKQIDSLKSTIKPVEKEIIVYKDRWRVLKEEEVKIEYPEECDEIVENLKEQLENCDTITRLQEKIIYVDREIIKKQEVIIEKMVLPKPKPWGVGVHLGYGTDGKDLQMYVGAGVSYNFIRL